MKEIKQRVKQRRIDMCKINVKKSILEIVEKNNLEILKIDLCNDYELAASFYDGGRNADFCRVYTPLTDLDFKIKFNQLLNETKQRFQKEFDEI